MQATRPLPTFELAQTLPYGFHFPTRMTVLPLEGNALALVSPIPIEDAAAQRLAALGEVRYLVAPNLMHHLYLEAAARRFPQARVVAPAGLSRKRPGLRIDHPLEGPLPDALAAAIDVVPLRGAPAIDEFAFYHRASRTLVVTDLVFNIIRPHGLVAHSVLRLVGCHGRLASSRMWRYFTKDRAAMRASLERLLALPFDALIMAHGEPVRSGAQPVLAAALARSFPGAPHSPQLATEASPR